MRQFDFRGGELAVRQQAVAQDVPRPGVSGPEADGAAVCLDRRWELAEVLERVTEIDQRFEPSWRDLDRPRHDEDGGIRVTASQQD
jgi:hypothetical protein